MNTIVNIYYWINRFFEILAMALIVVMTGITCYRVFMRFVLNFTPSWTEELTCILVIWVTLIGLAIGVRERIHLNIQMFVDALPEPAQKWINWGNIVLEFLLGLLLVIEGMRLCIQQHANTMSIVHIPFSVRLLPNSILYVFVPIAGLLIMVYALIHLFDKQGLFTLTTLHTREDIL